MPAGPRHAVKAVIALAALMVLVPAHALAQSDYGIVVQDNFGTHARGDSLFVFGSVARPDAGLDAVQPPQQRGEPRALTLTWVEV